MKVALIQPAMGRKEDRFVESWKMEPLAMAVLASVTPSRHEVAFFDDRVEPLDYDAPADLVAISVETYTARRAYQIARAYRQRGVKVVLGGYHATLVPNEVKEFADAVVYGEAEPLWEGLLADAEAGRLQAEYRATNLPKVYSVKPDRTIFASKKYLPLSLVETGRGCNFVCDFCSITSYFQQQVRQRPIAEVVDDVASTGRKRLFLVDDNLTADFARAKDLFRALTPLGITWLSQATINTGTDEELCRLMRQSGCAGILVGFESLSEATLRSMKKQFNQGVQKFRDSLERLRDHGLKIYATFVFGYDTDTPDLFERTLEFAMEQRFFVTAFNHLQPFPGTPLYARMEAERRLLYPRWWLEPGYHFGQVAFRPKAMSPDELYEKLRETRAKFFSWPSILQRACDFKANCRDLRGATYHFAVNWMLKKELREKWATPLGDLGEADPLFQGQ